MKTIFDGRQLPAALAAALAKPRVNNAITLTYGAYNRSFAGSNMIIVWSDRGQAPGVTQTLEFCGVQRTGLELGGTARRGGVIAIEVEWMDITKWLLEKMRPGDILGYIEENFPGDIKGPYRWIYQDVWAGSGRTYRIIHGDPEHFTTYRQYECIDSVNLFRAIAGVAADIFTGVARRRFPDWPIAVRFLHSMSRDPADLWGTTRSHWQCFEQDSTVDWNGLPTNIGHADRYHCIRIALNSSPTVSFHGLLHTPPEGSSEIDEDIIASWKSVWDWFSDECASAGVRLEPLLYTSGGGTEWWLDWKLKRVRDPHGFAIGPDPLTEYLPAPLELSPEDFNEDPRFAVGKQSLTGVTVSTPAGTSGDAEPVSTDDLEGTENDLRWNAPRGFHTNPIAWPDGDRVYRADDTTHADILTQAFNCLTMYCLSDADGLLDDPAMIRISHLTELDFGYGAGFRAGTNPGVTLPTPAIDEDWDFNVPDNYGGADEVLGTPYLVCVATAQRIAGMPTLTGEMMYELFGDKQNTAYTGPVDFLSCPPEQMGNQLDVATFPDGSILLDPGDTYFGELYGPPYVQSMEGDYLGKQETRVTLLGIAPP